MRAPGPVSVTGSSAAWRTVSVPRVLSLGRPVWQQSLEHQHRQPIHQHRQPIHQHRQHRQPIRQRVQPILQLPSAAAAAARDSVRSNLHRRRAQAPRRPDVVNLCLSAAGCANVLTDSQKHLNIAGSQRSAGGLLLPG